MDYTNHECVIHYFYRKKEERENKKKAEKGRKRKKEMRLITYYRVDTLLNKSSFFNRVKIKRKRG